MIHLKGYLTNQDNDDNKGPSLNKREKEEFIESSIADLIYQELGEGYEPSKQQNPGDDFEHGVDVSLYVPNVSIQIYSTKNQSTLDEAKEMMLLETFGDMDVYQEWVGYSEFTITGFDFQHFTIGNHNLFDVLSSYGGSYVHLLIDVKEE